MVLFRCETFYQLINAINIKMNLMASEEADIAFSKSTDFGEMIERVRESGVFSNVYSSEDSVAYSIELKHKAEQNKSKITNNPEKYLFNTGYESKKYDTIFWPTISSLYDYLLYYNFYKQHGEAPKIAIYEDGMATYFRFSAPDIIKYQNNIVNASKFPEKCRVEKNVIGLYLYDPSLMAVKAGCEVHTIPKITNESLEVLKRVFGSPELPKEKVIFFSEPFIDEFINNNEVQMLEMIAERVGKENIIVKNHPRNTADKFEKLGYKMFENSNLPWEIFASDMSVENKLIISISSTSIFSPKLLFDYKLNSIMLLRMATHNRFFATQKPFIGLVSKLETNYNEYERNLFVPSDTRQLMNALDYFMMSLEDNNG
ncbi:MAG: hypothetical protein IJZ65_09520 [Ruminiclostridium sp.]|nr:hypothetical protein [Ruminiclostridium sp.]